VIPHELSGLPAGWTADSWGANAVVVRCPDVGYVTIDYARRGYRDGVSTFGRLDSTITYTGRGWRAALESDAIARLSSFAADRAARS